MLIGPDCSILKSMNNEQFQKCGDASCNVDFRLVTRAFAFLVGNLARSEFVRDKLRLLILLILDWPKT